jgi:hypothetical protein
VVRILDEDVVFHPPPPASERRGVAVILALESAQVPAVTGDLPAMEAPAPPPMTEV